MLKRFKKSSRPLILLITAVILISLGVAFLKLSTKKYEPVWVKVKVSQGLWWATTDKPAYWLASAYRKGDAEYNLLGRKIAEVTEVRYYPFFDRGSIYEDKYNIYLTLKIAADKQGNNLLFKRERLSVGSPIELDLNKTLTTGTVIEISQSPFTDEYLEKTVTLTKRFAQPWEFDAIKIGDNYFDGEETVFEVLDKSKADTSVISADSFGNITPLTTEPERYVFVKAKVKVKKKGEQLLFGEEKILQSGTLLPIATLNFKFDGFLIAEVD